MTRHDLVAAVSTYLKTYYFNFTIFHESRYSILNQKLPEIFETFWIHQKNYKNTLI